ncbi:hypothetical protein BT96DRAFT_960719 [Gymnopus androsaceus JB14]|uniref:Uncharacterized protein n=1 Tax=Gymnopus androsaceus JB14 TaxID=1447944 RepID=A0A6A4GJS8_9AGAR|nr:hypothetical protein BT96DRAFT_960719 [Gymnopus androsaceus JB14]
MSWWCFPFERLIGALQKINTNDHIRGEMEATIIKSVTRTANIRRWLRRPDCPEAVRQLKVMFDNANFSPSTTHPGNATIIYRPSPAGRPVGGVIQEIRNVNTSGIQVRVHPFESLPASLYDPFSRYPHLSAKSYSSTLREESDMITLDAIVAHAACFDYTHNRTVLVNLYRD